MSLSGKTFVRSVPATSLGRHFRLPVDTATEAELWLRGCTARLITRSGDGYFEESLKSFSDAAAPQKKQTEQLLADLKENKPLPPLAKVDAVAALEQARVRFRARAELATLPLTQSALPLLDQMLGPAESTQQVFERLDRQYREQIKPKIKPEIWFLPLSQPIAPHLDELLGPLPMTEKK